ncbi:hypothetical protein V6N11_004541 [Hibiscus sabdariffa]|uniref:Secreted protein n=1 Tax=Hibiscus sabdariffa TaxID=183260 RepID=A0ABR2SGV3_9ROSI
MQALYSCIGILLWSNHTGCFSPFVYNRMPFSDVKTRHAKEQSPFSTRPQAFLYSCFSSALAFPLLKLD